MLNITDLSWNVVYSKCLPKRQYLQASPGGDIEVVFTANGKSWYSVSYNLAHEDKCICTTGFLEPSTNNNTYVALIPRKVTEALELCKSENNDGTTNIQSRDNIEKLGFDYIDRARTQDFRDDDTKPAYKALDYGNHHWQNSKYL